MAERNVTIRLKVNGIDNYTAAIERARLETTGLADELRALGVPEDEITEAIRTTLKIMREEDNGQ